MVNLAPQKDYLITVIRGIQLVRMPAQLSAINALNFRPIFEEICQNDPTPTRIILDMSQTNFIDSRGIGVLVICLKEAQKQGIDLLFWSVRPQVKMALSLLGLDKTFVIDPNTEALMKAGEGYIVDAQPIVTHPSIRSRVKRGIDIVGALVGLGITAVLAIPIAVAIQLDNPGPIFFGQFRCGWMGRQFRIWKFRSMVINAEALKDQVTNQIEGALFKNDHDPRVTRVGRFLRRTSLDELPQFWNVLRGEMSLVGTRPPTPDEVERYDLPAWQRFDVKPGITGEWQVNGRSRIRTFEEVVQLDLRYQQNWSVAYDFKLIWKTIIMLAKKDNGAV